MEKDDHLIKALLENIEQHNGKKTLTCAKAFKLAGEFKTEIIQVGNICNEQGIKIRKCQLGCFP